MIKHSLLATLTLILITLSNVQAQEPIPVAESIDEPLYKPFIERYILDELKLLRQQLQAMRAEMAEKVAEARLDASDRAMRYTTDTTNNIFFIITGAASILVLLGWRSLREVQENVEATVERKVSKLTGEYEQRLYDVERKLKVRSEQILAAQEKISETNQIHSLWMRAGLESSLHEQINIYDQILEINPEDVEALTYKADVLMDLGETRWALSLSNQAIEHDADYPLAYWQRACAEAELGQQEAAVRDITLAIEKSPALKDELDNENAFRNLRDFPSFLALLNADTV
ncbi:MAG: hypothetical protein B0D91_10035 [Oceanospirillales bacterium LUC14_002_19_P2]|nr:MAG: hypothetical protein B0D91_10035 [Oceanospirillales bacterium LUC14_002_19_P2]